LENIRVRVAALYDIHGNLPALEAVLRDVRVADADAVVVGGDVLPGPMSRETLACLTALDLPVHFIQGNGDRVVAAFLEGGDISEVPEAFRASIAWTAQQLDAAQRELLTMWPPTCQLEIDGVGRTLFCHATPRNDVECFTRATLDARLEPVFAAVASAVVVCGHTHMQFDRRVAEHRIINAGSVGMPFAGPPGVYWLMLADGIQLRRTDYDFEATAAQFRRTAFPLVESMAVRYVLSPPTEAESLQMFAAAELGA
jgi:predicted phosphodiesterase